MLAAAVAPEEADPAPGDGDDDGDWHARWHRLPFEVQARIIRFALGDRRLWRGRVISRTFKQAFDAEPRAVRLSHRSVGADGESLVAWALLHARPCWHVLVDAARALGHDPMDDLDQRLVRVLAAIVRSNMSAPEAIRVMAADVLHYDVALLVNALRHGGGCSVSRLDCRGLSFATPTYPSMELLARIAPHLEVLQLSWQEHVEDKWVVELAEAAGAPGAKLIHLDLCGNEITDAAAATNLAAATLHRDANGGGGAGTYNGSELGGGGGGLRRLLLSSNSLDDQAVIALADALGSGRCALVHCRHVSKSCSRHVHMLHGFIKTSSG